MLLFISHLVELFSEQDETPEVIENIEDGSWEKEHIIYGTDARTHQRYTVTVPAHEFHEGAAPVYKITLS